MAFLSERPTRPPCCRPSFPKEAFLVSEPLPHSRRPLRRPQSIPPYQTTFKLSRTCILYLWNLIQFHEWAFERFNLRKNVVELNTFCATAPNEYFSLIYLASLFEPREATVTYCLSPIASIKKRIRYPWRVFQQKKSPDTLSTIRRSITAQQLTS